MSVIVEGKDGYFKPRYIQADENWPKQPAAEQNKIRTEQAHQTSQSIRSQHSIASQDCKAGWGEGAQHVHRPREKSQDTPAFTNKFNTTQDLVLIFFMKRKLSVIKLLK